MKLSLPPVFVIELTNQCNAQCIMCPQNLQETKGDICISLIEKISPQIRTFAKCIQLYFLGEPTLHTDLNRIIKHFKCHTNAAIEVSTNLSVYDSYREWEDFLQSGVDRVYCCIEGVSQKSHISLRSTGNFEKAVTAVKNMSKIKMNRQLDTDIVVKNIGTIFNKNEQKEIKQFWEEIPGTRTLTSWMNTWAGFMPSLKKIGLIEAPNSNAVREACAELWNKMVIRWNGKVVLCCHDWKPEHILGDSNSESLFNIWNGEKIIAARNAHMRKNFSGICAKCKEWSVIKEYISDYGIKYSDLTMPEWGRPR